MYQHLITRLPMVDIPSPQSNSSLDALGGSIGGLLLTIAVWAALIAAVIALVRLVLSGDSERRRDHFKWFLICIVTYIVAQSFATFVPAVKNIVISPLSVLGLK